MERIILPKVPPDHEAFLTKVLDRAMGVPDVVDSAPTSEQITPNSWMKHGTDIYVRFSDGVTLKITATVVA